MTLDHWSKRKDFAVHDLNPVFQTAAKNLIGDMSNRIFQQNAKYFRLVPFEGYRSPMRQDNLFAGAKVTKARSWESAHQYGLAMDFAGVWTNNSKETATWFWPLADHLCWQELKRRAGAFGLDIPIAWDYGHVVHPLWNIVKRELKRNEWNWIA